MPHLYYCFNPTDGRSPSEVASLEHDLGRRLLAFGLREQYDLSFSEKDLSFGPKGKPYLTEHPEIHFSISHCRGLVVCALNDQSIGADAEAPRKRIFASIKRRILSAEEQAFLDRFSDDPALERLWFLRFWTLKEAYVKYLGTGISSDLKAVSFSFDNDEQPICSDLGLTCFQTVLNDGFVISLVCKEPASAAELHEISFSALLE